ncbi:MAG: trypsin-like peptidase domain-containing protein [Myxococcota bacterium]|nr:trypsin-like peptidase domain-containing protein [Myxococcota bacterium]
MTVAALACLVSACSPPPKSPEANQPKTRSQVKLASNNGATSCHPDFVSVFAQISPSTVGIAAGRRDEGRFQAKRRGTAFVWDINGHLVTNAHLVAESEMVRVRRRDGKVFVARIIGLDVPTDLAVLKVDDLQLHPVPRIVAPDIKPGEWVAAIGHPFGMEYSIAVGVISAVGRFDVPGLTQHRAEFIQSDVAIFQGNSGGPLVNTRGEVIGLNTAKKGEGLSFSTHISAVELVVSRIIKHGHFERGFAGLYPQAVSYQAAENADLSEPHGARIRALVGDGPADKAGLQPGDIILAINGRRIVHHKAVAWQIAATPPGRVVKLLVAREDERLNIAMTLGRLP